MEEGKILQFPHHFAITFRRLTQKNLLLFKDTKARSWSTLSTLVKTCIASERIILGRN